MSTTAIVFAERVDGAMRWGFRVGSVLFPLALMPPFAATADEAARFAVLFADEVFVAAPVLVPHAGPRDRVRSAA